MRLTETQFEILKLCYENKDQDVLFSNKELKAYFPEAEYRDTAFLHNENCLEKFGHENDPQYIISKRGEEVYLDNIDRRENDKMQKRSYKVAMLSLIFGMISTVASVAAAFFAYYFR